MLLVQDEADEVVRYWRDKADFETKRRARPDYYRVLNVSTLASEREIRAAYKSRALECHPDKPVVMILAATLAAVAAAPAMTMAGQRSVSSRMPFM